MFIAKFKQTVGQCYDKDTYVLSFIYFLTFISLVFANIEDVAFMKVDPSSITNSIYGMFEPPYYNLLDTYHSRYYGWTYFFINFIGLMPLKILYTIDNYLVTNFAVRLILFMIGLFAVAVFHKLVRTVINNRFIVFVATLYFIFSPPLSHFWYTIHPESTGVLFFLLGIIMFLKYQENNEIKSYYLAITFLVLSSLAKQPFFVMALPVVFYMMATYCRSSGKGYGACFATREIWFLLAKTAVLALFILLIIHPYAIFQAPEFIRYQMNIVDKHSTKVALFESLENWVELGIKDPLLTMNMLIMLAAISARAMKVRVPGLYLFSLVASNVIVLIFMALERYFFYITYMAPLFPVFILNIALAATYVIRNVAVFRNNQLLKGVLALVLVYPAIASALVTIGNSMTIALLHDQTTKDLSWNYIKALPEEAKIVYDPTVAVPPAHRKKACHVWRGCGKATYLEKYNPDYFIIYTEYQYMNKDVIFAYIDNNEFCEIEHFDASIPDSKKQYIAEKTGFIPDLSKGFQRINALYDIWKSGEIIGNKITVFKRC